MLTEVLKRRLAGECVNSHMCCVHARECINFGNEPYMNQRLPRPPGAGRATVGGKKR